MMTKFCPSLSSTFKNWLGPCLIIILTYRRGCLAVKSGPPGGGAAVLRAVELDAVDSGGRGEGEAAVADEHRVRPHHRPAGQRVGGGRRLGVPAYWGKLGLKARAIEDGGENQPQPHLLHYTR